MILESLQDIKRQLEKTTFELDEQIKEKYRSTRSIEDCFDLESDRSKIEEAHSLIEECEGLINSCNNDY